MQNHAGSVHAFGPAQIPPSRAYRERRFVNDEPPAAYTLADSWTLVTPRLGEVIDADQAPVFNPWWQTVRRAASIYR